jgi:hypothetical protein
MGFDPAKIANFFVYSAKARKLLDGREQIFSNGIITRELAPWLTQKRLDTRKDGSAHGVSSTSPRKAVPHRTAMRPFFVLRN